MDTDSLMYTQNSEIRFISIKKKSIFSFDSRYNIAKEHNSITWTKL